MCGAGHAALLWLLTRSLTGRNETLDASAQISGNPPFATVAPAYRFT
jgi:hypothetical protein